jgi:maltokinase
MSSGSLADLLAAWLPAQRWFAGSGAILRDLVISSDVRLKVGDPELAHLIVDATTGTETVRYQVLVGITATLKPSLGPAAIGTLADGRVAYDAAVDPQLTAVLLSGIASQRTEGPIAFRLEAGAGAAIDKAAAGRTLPAAASNTSVVFGDKAILKLLRRPSPGQHPDLELPSQLARLGSRLVAAPRGWIELSAADDEEPTVLAILAEYFANSRDGWSLAIADLESAEPDFSSQAGRLGQATAQLHAELAAAFGASVLPPTALADMARIMAAELSMALGVVPELAEHERAIRASYAELADLTSPVAIQRIHGDYHLAQVLGTQAGWVILDFEGEPSVPLARRRAYAPTLRDVAGMLRSFDYVARHQARRDPDDRRLQDVAADWADRCRNAFCAGYREASGTDPRRSGPLLRALLLQKAVYEAVYEARHRPGWLPIPLHAIAEAVYE